MKTARTSKKLSSEYIAGYFDGEGCIRVGLNKDRTNAAGLHVFITNTYLPLLKKLEEEFGGTTSLRNKSNPKHRTIYQWRICGKEKVKNFLDFISPHLVEKAPQARLALEFCELPVLRANRFSKSWKDTLKARNRRIELALKLKALKKVDYPN